MITTLIKKSGDIFLPESCGPTSLVEIDSPLQKSPQQTVLILSLVICSYSQHRGCSPHCKNNTVFAVRNNTLAKCFLMANSHFMFILLFVWDLLLRMIHFHFQIYMFVRSRLQKWGLTLLQTHRIIHLCFHHEEEWVCVKVGNTLVEILHFFFTYHFCFYTHIYKKHK